MDSDYKHWARIAGEWIVWAHIDIVSGNDAPQS
jgi:hypothetical protein